MVAEDPDRQPDPTSVKASLSRLADADETAIIKRADAATESLEAAAEFVETTGLAELAAAVETVETTALEERGERALSAFRRFRAAAEGRLDADDQFHRGRGIDLRGDDEGSSRWHG